MITVKHRNDGMTIEGHAGYAPIGQDIVCAAVSALLQTFVMSVETLTTDEIKYDIAAGEAVIEYGNLSERAQLLMDSLFVGLRLIADEYPANVHIA